MSQFIEMFENYPRSTKLGDVFILMRNGANIKQGQILGGIPITRIETISEGVVDRGKLGYAGIFDDKYRLFYLEDNDILVSHINSIKHIGKCALYKKVQTETIIHGMNLLCLRHSPGMINPIYALYLLRSEDMRKSIVDITKPAVNQASFTVKDLAGILIKLPPINEQNKFSTIAQQADKSKFIGFKSQFIEMFGGCLNKVEITSLCDVFIDGDWIESRDQSDIGIRLIQTGNVGNGFFKDKDDKSRFINEETFTRLNCTEIMAGDVLVSRLPEPIGRACIIPNSIGKAITAVDCTIMRFKDTLLPEFFIAYTQTPDYQLQINKVSTGTTRRRVSRMNLGKIRIICPSIDEQKQFVEIAQQADKSKYIN